MGKLLKRILLSPTHLVHGGNKTFLIGDTHANASQNDDGPPIAGPAVLVHKFGTAQKYPVAASTFSYRYQTSLEAALLPIFRGIAYIASSSKKCYLRGSITYINMDVRITIGKHTVRLHT